MKFCTYRDSETARIGLVDSDAGAVQPLDFRGDMTELIRRYDRADKVPVADGKPIPLGQVQLLAPVPRPRRNIFCVGKNYREHAREFSRSGFDVSAQPTEDIPDVPIFFTKPPSAVIGPGVPIDGHYDLTHELDYEAELAVVIGRGGRAISVDRAYDYVWGYTIVNDITARDLQKRHRQWFLGKSLDGFCPMGPWLVAADELVPDDIDLTCWVNGEQRQHANTRDLIFDIPRLIATLSAGIALEPGDIIATGTPAGVGIGFSPPKFLNSGDEIRIGIAGIGELVNRVG
ncbi:MAG TPA: fumarylacetoacetate hydrolase family protein [Xanthobacteraceae bacterium]|nr:fumarylacetoacetate hydrolase family protein [Xanthobacteraceae bacterium]